jgi:amino acid adenylation domain-containing protein
VTPITLPDLLARAAGRSPDAIAVIDGSETLTYGQLDAASGALAAHLGARGVQPGDRVALHLDKSAASVVAIYGILRAGAAYVPLDPAAPASRVALIAADAEVAAVCTTRARLDATLTIVPPPGDCPIVLLDDDAPPCGPATVSGRDAWVGTAAATRRRIGADLAYILYTSGSTGTPKGVMLTHTNALAFVEWAVDAVGLQPEDIVSSHAPLHFDLSVFDLFGAAAAGAPVVLVPASVSRFPVELRRFIEDAGITVWYSVPSILTMLTRRGGLERGSLASVRTIVFAGEVFPTKYLRRLMEFVPHATYWNWYGPTETNVCTAYRVDTPPGGDDPIPIGRAISPDEAYVVTDDGRRAAPGEAGVLHVRGATVMAGYWHDADRTQAVLRPSPLHAPLPDVAYRTGDLVRERPDGNLEFLGRVDAQVKSRGYRIELGDVEAAIYAHPDVEEAAVVAVPDEMVTNRLHAFVVARGDLEPRALLDFCRTRVPPYMVPDRLALLDALPQTSTGKVDRRALAARAAGQPPSATAQGAPS